MNKNVVIISSSPRENSNSDVLCKEFEKGALSSNNNVEYIRLKDTKINYCIGCYACRKTGRCFQQDDMQQIQDKLLKADVIVFATPVYYYTMASQLKTLIDRLTPFYTKIRSDIYIMATAWDTDKNNLKLVVESIRGCTRDCLENCNEKGVLVVGGVHTSGSINNRPELKQAFEMGKNC